MCLTQSDKKKSAYVATHRQREGNSEKSAGPQLFRQIPDVSKKLNLQAFLSYLSAFFSAFEKVFYEFCVL